MKEELQFLNQSLIQENNVGLNNEVIHGNENDTERIDEMISSQPLASDVIFASINDQVVGQLLGDINSINEIPENFQGRGSSRGQTYVSIEDASNNILQTESEHDSLIQAICQSAKEEIEKALNIQREQFRKELELVREQNNIENKVANALLNLVGNTNTVVGLNSSNITENRISSQAHVKSRDLQIPKYARVHEAKTPFNFNLKLKSIVKLLGIPIIKY